jgi:uncharacterized protein YceH (UPF0502 family)
MTITPAGGRVLGSLVEKQLTTPQQYPLSLHALALACSQTTNRAPVMSLDDGAVERALDELKARRVVRFVLPSHGKSVTRFRHVLDEAYGLDNARAALVAVLLLRGPQTAGELRIRTERMAAFSSVGAVVDELEALARPPEPLVRLLPRQPGQKEDRWQQLLAAESSGTHAPPPPDRYHPDLPSDERVVPAGGGADPDDGLATPADLDGRVETLTSEVAALRSEVAGLAATLDHLRRSLGE